MNASTTALAVTDRAPTPSTAASTRAAALVAGISLALMAVLAPLGLLVALPAGLTGPAAVAVLVIAVLDVIVGVALYPILRPGGELIAQVAAALRVAYGAAFAVAAGALLEPADPERFQAMWDAALFVFGLHLLAVGIAAVRASSIPTWIGVLVLIAGAGYAIDAVSVALAPSAPLGIGQFVFVGEVVLLVWLIGWGGRRTPAVR
ncbi:DUF4386 family protein [Agromyces sp. ZXT2-6]|uniref:DUF4386 family protein n=1 Tax=Agromyces sp. ZXT2-6 TaxID=3461153 RepID=UPI00405521B0